MSCFGSATTVRRVAAVCGLGAQQLSYTHLAHTGILATANIHSARSTSTLLRATVQARCLHLRSVSPGPWKGGPRDEHAARYAAHTTPDKGVGGSRSTARDGRKERRDVRLDAARWTWLNPSRISQFARQFTIKYLKVVSLALVVFWFVADISPCGGTSMLPLMLDEGEIVVSLRLPFYRAIERFLPDKVVGHEATQDAGEKNQPTAYVGGPRGKYDPAMGTGLRVGDLITAIKPTDPQIRVCKRIIALAGDTVLLDPRVEALPLGDATTPSESNYIKAAPQYIVVPKGHVWVSGDNLANSTDSRHYGPVPLGLIDGRAVARIFPRPTWFANTLQPIPTSPAATRPVT